MSLFTKDSLDTLKSRVDLVSVLEGFIDLKRAGAAYKALCPFHDEKSPSFTVQRGDSHYHCFGCGAHGDAIAFLMNHQKLSFSDAVEFLADKFQVHLEKAASDEPKGPSKKGMRDAMDISCRVFHALLLHTEEGHKALHYLFARGITLDFVKKFELGYSLEKPGVLHALLKAKGIHEEIAEACGLIKGTREFFSGRLLFPIRSAAGNVIGYSGRKIKEETFGGKYINTPETPLFKKSRVLFGLNYSRNQIIKKRIALVVEGQIDALRLIDAGFDYTVAGQGTAFGEGHVQELVLLGIHTVYLAFDSDKAGLAAASKVGDLFQKEGIGVKIVRMPKGEDPDVYLKERGKEAFNLLIENAEDYLAFLVKHLSEEIQVDTPAGKNELAKVIEKQIRSWPHPLLVHESLKKLADLLKIPESIVGVGAHHLSHFYLKKTAFAGHSLVDPDWVLETDVLVWLLRAASSEMKQQAKTHLNETSFQVPVCRAFYQVFAGMEDNTPWDLFQISQINEGAGQKLLEELSQKKIREDKNELYFSEALQRLLDRNWMNEREAVRMAIQSGSHSDEEALELAKKFEMIKRTAPLVVTEKV